MYKYDAEWLHAIGIGIIIFIKIDTKANNAAIDTINGSNENTDTLIITNEFDTILSNTVIVIVNCVLNGWIKCLIINVC